MKRSPLRLLVCALALCLICGCKRTAEQKQDVYAFRKPSAAELFDLESKCNASGQKVLEGNTIGSALTQSQVSRYNPADNRCYVLLNVTTADLRTSLDEFTSDYFLEDGQTGETLATRHCKGRKCTADVSDESLKGMVKDPITPSEVQVRELMERFVHADRRLTTETP